MPSKADGMSALLRPDASRGELIGAGVVVLALTVALVNLRFNQEWGIGIHFVYSALAATIVINLAAMAERTRGPPPAWQSALFVVSFVLLVITLGNLADLLGGDDGLSSSGTLVWIGALLIALMGWFSLRFDSGISTLLAAITFVAVLVSFVDWVFTPEGNATFRWILLVGALALAGFAARGPQRGVHHRVGYVNAAGVAVLGIGVLYGLDAIGTLFGTDEGLGADTGWELAILLGGFALLAYSAWARQSGPAYLGVLNLIAFGLLAYTPEGDGPSLIGWPVVLALLSAGLLVAGLRPRPGTSPGPPPRAPEPAPGP